MKRTDEEIKRILVDRESISFDRSDFTPVEAVDFAIGFLKTNFKAKGPFEVIVPEKQDKWVWSYFSQRCKYFKLGEFLVISADGHSAHGAFE